MDSRFIGTWRKEPGAACASTYPDTLDIRANDLYFGRNDTPGTFAVWDSGTFEVLDAEQVRVSTANDARILYRYRFQAGALEFRDESGCQFRYRRI